MAISATYDDQADALYLRIRAGERARTEEFDDRHYIDLDQEGNPLGIEILYPGMGLALEAISERFGLQQQLVELVEAAELSNPVTAAQAPYTAATQVLGATYSLVLSPGAPTMPPQPASRSSSAPPEVLVS
jgi:uncharacterized protein YuzE